MTLFRYSRPDQTGIDRVVAGLLEFSLVNREEVGGRFRIQQVFSAPLDPFQLDDGQWVGQADVTLPVTGPTQGVRVRERLLPNVGSRTYTVVVPNPAPLYATDLVEVDPSTLTPSTESVTAWEAITESIGATLTATQGAASQAERSAITANASAGQASDSAAYAASVIAQALDAATASSQSAQDAQAAAAGMVVDGTVTAGDLILTRQDGTTSNAGRVGLNVVQIPQSVYDTLDPLDPTTLYIRTEG